MPPTIFPTGVTIYKPQKAYNSFVLFEGRDTNSYLIDMNGNDAKVFGYGGMPTEFIDPVLTGGKPRLFVQKEPEMFENKTLLEIDWEENIVWQWGEQAPGGAAQQNHDQARLPNGNTLILSVLIHDVEGLSAPAVINQPEGKIVDQVIYEVNLEGDVVWSWVASDHLEEFGFSEEGMAFLQSERSRPRPYLLVLNNMRPLRENKWYDNGDDRFHPDNIIIDSRDGNVIAIIEKASGKIVWRLGPDYPGAYDYSKQNFSGDVPRPVDLISGQHDAHLIPKSLPGAGNLLVFDNKGTAGFPPFYMLPTEGSRVLEIDPIAGEIVWQYDASMSKESLGYWTFMSGIISSARRLPNGNTLICEGVYGRLFQVTPEGEIVWEYVNPHFGEFPHLHGRGLGHHMMNLIYRAQPVPYDWVPEGTPHSEDSIVTPDRTKYRVSQT